MSPAPAWPLRGEPCGGGADAGRCRGSVPPPPPAHAHWGSAGVWACAEPAGPGRSPSPPRGCGRRPGKGRGGCQVRAALGVGAAERSGMNSSDEEKQLELLASLKERGEGRALGWAPSREGAGLALGQRLRSAPPPTSPFPGTAPGSERPAGDGARLGGGSARF